MHAEVSPSKFEPILSEIEKDLFYRNTDDTTLKMLALEVLEEVRLRLEHEVAVVELDQVVGRESTACSPLASS